MVGVPAVVLLGFLALLGRAGVGIQIAGLPLGALLTPISTLLVVALLVLPRGRRLLAEFSGTERRIAILVAVAVLAGVARAGAQGFPTLLRLQDMAYLLHLPWMVVGMAAMRLLRTDDERNRVLTWIAWMLLTVLGLHSGRGMIAPFESLFLWLSDALSGVSDKPSNLMKAGDQALYGVTLAALSLYLARARVPARLRSLRVLIAGSGLLFGTQLTSLIFGGSRGALLGATIGFSALIILNRARNMASRILLVGITIGLVGMSALTLTTPATPPTTESSSIPPPSTPHTTDGSRSDARTSLRESYEELTGRRGLTATLNQVSVQDGRLSGSSTVGWRISIWTEVVEEWNASWSNRLFGIGFGNEIEAMTLPGRQGFDGLNRGVHSIAFTILARQGLFGLYTALRLVGAVIVGAPSSRLLVVPVTTTALVAAMFDVFLEGVQAPVFLWVFIGLALGQSDQGSRESISSNSST
jgi:hypothetical protein